jgi:hypothetical protein
MVSQQAVRDVSNAERKIGHAEMTCIPIGFISATFARTCTSRMTISISKNAARSACNLIGISKLSRVERDASITALRANTQEWNSDSVAIKVILCRLSCDIWIVQNRIYSFLTLVGGPLNRPHWSCPSATSIAFNSPRALLRVSSYSLAGTLSATMPAPAWT